MIKKILIGFFVGILATICGFFFYVEFFSEFDFSKSMKVINEGKLYGKILGYAVIPNLFVFFVFIKKKQDYKARGVLIATILIALTILILKFI